MISVVGMHITHSLSLLDLSGCHDSHEPGWLMDLPDGLQNLHYHQLKQAILFTDTRIFIIVCGDGEVNPMAISSIIINWEV